MDNLPDEAVAGQSNPMNDGTTESRRIEDIVASGELKVAMKRVEDFFSFIDEEKITLTTLQSQEATLHQEYAIKQRISANDHALRNNQLTDAFLQFAYVLKREMLRTFKIAELPVVSNKFTSETELLRRVMEELLYGRYQILDPIPGGNSGLFFLAQNKQSKQKVVLKVLKVNDINDLPKEDLERVLKLKHRNLIKIVDQYFDRLPALVIIEFINGAKLSEALDILGEFSLDDSLRMIRQLFDALDYIRKRNIRHMNIRPSKIYIDDEGMPMISPLDVIKYDKTELRSLSRFKEDCRYLSPEALNETIDFSDLNAVERSDQFSLGLIFLEMLTAKPLFQKSTVPAIIAERNLFFKNLSATLESCLQKRQGKSLLIRILKKMLAEDPAQRYEDLSEALDELKIVHHRLGDFTPAQKSFSLCRRKHYDLIDQFYKRLLVSFPDLQQAFINPQRQQMMLKLAIGVLLDIENKSETFIGILKLPGHKPFTDPELYRQFFEILRDTIRELLRDDWAEPQMTEDWNRVIASAMKLVELHGYK